MREKIYIDNISQLNIQFTFEYFLITLVNCKIRQKK